MIESRATEDVESRYRYLARTASFEVAEAWLDEVTNAMKSLETLPDRCPLAPEDDSFPVSIRHLLHRADRILFTVSHGTRVVHVLHVRHGARDTLAR